MGSSRNIWIFYVEKSLEIFSIDWSKLMNMTTDGASAIMLPLHLGNFSSFTETFYKDLMLFIVLFLRIPFFIQNVQNESCP